MGHMGDGEPVGVVAHVGAGVGVDELFEVLAAKMSENMNLTVFDPKMTV